MRRNATRALALIAGLLCCSAPAMAADDEQGSGLSLGVTGGTNGLGVEAGYRFNSRVALRANAANYKYSKTVDSDDFDIDGDARLESVGGLVDFYPFGGSFRISAGMRSNKNRFGGIASPIGNTVELGDDIYTAAEVGNLTGTVKFKKTAPTATLGWGGKFTKGLHFGFELGVVAQGSAQLAASSSGTLANDPAFQADLDDKLTEWEEDAKDYKLWPVIQLNLIYRF
jgi:hypothetical protein